MHAIKGDFAPFASMASSWISIKTGLSPPKFEIALKERGDSVLVLGFHGSTPGYAVV